MFKKKILVIDDTEFMTKLISDVLMNEGYEVVTASNGRQGIEMVRMRSRIWFCSMLSCPIWMVLKSAEF